MVIRRGGDFDLARSGEFAILRHHLAHDFTLLFPHAMLVRQAEIASPRHPLADFGIVGLKLLVEPGQLRPHLQIAEILRAEHRPRAGIPLPQPGVQQFAVAGIAIDHALRVGIEGMAEQECAIGVAQLLGGFESELKERIDGVAGSVLGHLRHHGRHQVEGLTDLGKLLQHLHHAVVVLQRVHACPGEFVLAGNQVLIEGLVHVPQEAQVYLRHSL